MNKAIKVVIILLILLSPIPFFLFTSTPAAATANMTQPDSTPEISNIHVNHNLLATEDTFFYFQYRLPYASTTGLRLASQAFTFALVSDNGTVVGTITPYPYYNNGYNYGNSSFYLSANASITWGGQYRIRVLEQASAFSSPASFPDTSIPAIAYSSFNGTSDNQREIAANVIGMARFLQNNYGGNPLLEQSGGGTILSTPEGEDYYRGAMYGLQALAPTLFLVQIITLDTAATGWTTAQFDTYETQFNGTWVGQSTNATAVQFGLTQDEIMGFGFVGILILGCIIVSAVKFKQTEPGLMAAMVLLIWGARMGWIPTAIFASINQILGIYVAYLWQGARA